MSSPDPHTTMQNVLPEQHPMKPGDQPPEYTPGAPVMQPAPYPAYYPPVQQTMICQQPSTNVVVVNNNIGQTVSSRPRNKDYLCWSILNMLFCCCPIGVAAIVFSCKTRDDIDAHDHVAAAKNSRTAFYLNISALVVGILIEVIFAAVYFTSNVHMSPAYTSYTNMGYNNN